MHVAVFIYGIIVKAGVVLSVTPNSVHLCLCTIYYCLKHQPIIKQVAEEQVDSITCAAAATFLIQFKGYRRQLY